MDGWVGGYVVGRWGVGVRLFMFISSFYSYFLVIIMTIGHPHHFVISHGCHIDEIKVMKTNIPHFVTTSSSTNHMPH